MSIAYKIVLVDGGTGRKHVERCATKLLMSRVRRDEVWLQSKLVLNVMLDSKLFLHIVAIAPLRDRF